jgi:hypothetical protein
MSCIEAIFAKNFRGQTFHDDLVGQKHLYTAPVGTGKSTRVNALQLLITGSIPAAGLSKKIGDIMAAMCQESAEEMRVGARISGTTYERVIRRTKTGGATQKFYVNGENANKNVFEMSLHTHSIRIADLQSFVDLSEEKKQQHLFALFPPSGDIQELSSELTQKKERLKKIKAKMREQKEIVKTLKSSRAMLNLPAKSLPEVENEIEGRKAELEAFQKEMAERKGRIAAEKEADNLAAESPAVSSNMASTEEPPFDESAYQADVQQPVPETPVQESEASDPFSLSNPENAKLMDKLYSKTEGKSSVPEPSHAKTTPYVLETALHDMAPKGATATATVANAMAAIGKALSAQDCAGMCAVNLVYKQQLKKLKKAGIIHD